MTTLTLKMLEDMFAATRCSPEEFAREMRLPAAIFWYAWSPGPPSSCPTAPKASQ